MHIKRYQFLLAELQKEISPAECLIWPHGRHKAGYGVCFHSDRVWLVHHLSYAIHNGISLPIPLEGVIRHACDNPPCFNPFHLILGTQAENMQDAVARNRIRKGSTSGTAILNDAQVLEIKLLLQTKTQKEIGELFGVSRSCIEDIACSRTWTHLV